MKVSKKSKDQKRITFHSLHSLAHFFTIDLGESYRYLVEKCKGAIHLLCHTRGGYVWRDILKKRPTSISNNAGY